MKMLAAARAEIPLSLPQPVSIDDIRTIRPNLFVFQPRDAINANRPRPRSRGEAGGAAIRIVSAFQYSLIKAFINYGRPAYESGDFVYEKVLDEGADLIFLSGRQLDILQCLKLDPLLCDIPVVIVDTVETRENCETRDRYLRGGADAVLFVPIDPVSVLSAIDVFLPPYTP